MQIYTIITDGENASKDTQTFSIEKPISDKSKPPATGSKCCQKSELATSGSESLKNGKALVVIVKPIKNQATKKTAFLRR